MELGDKCCRSLKQAKTALQLPEGKGGGHLASTVGECSIQHLFVGILHHHSQSEAKQVWEGGWEIKRLVQLGRNKKTTK